VKNWCQTDSCLLHCMQWGHSCDPGVRLLSRQPGEDLNQNTAFVLELHSYSRQSYSASAFKTLL